MLDPILWFVPPVWRGILLTGILVMLGVVALWFSIIHFRWQGPIYKPLLRAIVWMALFPGSFLLIFWLLSLFLPEGWLGYLVFAFVWWLISEVLKVIWESFDVWLWSWYW
jgi:hypothetical protein